MEHRINFEFSGRYHTLGDKNSSRETWIVLHGYGQLAGSFIRRFSVLENHGIRIIAPEALSRFYMQDTEQRMKSGDARVGASWMTREDRLADIDNYIAFLNAVYAREVDPASPITVVGFSQGAATATRWLLDGKVGFSRLILWAGILPPDIDFSRGKELLTEKDIVLVYGTRDPFLNDARFTEMNLLAEKLGVKPRQIVFDGEHEIDATTLKLFV